MNAEWISAIIGGMFIGLAVSLMLIFNGRVTGISGIIYGLFSPTKGDIAWRIHFIAGLLAGGFIFHFLTSGTIVSFQLSNFDWKVSLAGLLVGFGTVLGSGCTSGHGVCGLSRLSPRSLVATVTFILSGIATVWILR